MRYGAGDHFSLLLSYNGAERSYALNVTRCVGPFLERAFRKTIGNLKNCS